MNNQNLKLGAVALALLGVLPGAFAANPTTVGVLDPTPNGQTIVDSPANVGNANFLTESSLNSLISTAFANNTGGVITFDTVDGWANNVNANAFTVSYGTSQSSLFTLTRGDGGNTMGPSSGANTTQVSGGQFLGFQNSASPIILNFSQGLVDWGFTELNRGASRDVTLSFTLADSSVINYALQNQDPSGNNSGSLDFYGFQASAANPLISVTITANGFTRWDDMAFITVPEPGAISLAIAGGVSLSFMIARRRKV